MRPSPPRHSPMKSTLKSALKSTLKPTLVSAACMSAGCVSTPAPRPVIPTECPPGSEETLRRYGIEPGGWVSGVMAPTYAYSGSMPPTIEIKEGLWTSYTLITRGNLQTDSKLKGVLRLDKGVAQGYFTQLEPWGTDEKLPICLRLTSQFMPESRPGRPIVTMLASFLAVSSFE